MTDEYLLDLAKKYSKNAYCPYSNIHIGAVVLCKNDIFFGGCNVENSSYGATICAERTAICKAVSEGHRDIEALYIYSDDVKPYPCGICRQFLAEFVQDCAIIISDGNNIIKKTLNELLTYRFGDELK